MLPVLKLWLDLNQSCLSEAVNKLNFSFKITLYITFFQNFYAKDYISFSQYFYAVSSTRGCFPPIILKCIKAWQNLMILRKYHLEHYTCKMKK